MRQKLSSILSLTHKILAQLTIARYQPRMIGITGSVGKTSVKNAIYAVLGKDNNRSLRVAESDLKNEFGLSLAIFGDYKASGGFMSWVRVLVCAVWRLVFLNKDYPETLVVEYGANKPGDMKNLLEIVRPDIAVVTVAGEIPAHVEFYGDPSEAILEYGKPIKGLRYNGIAILNSDDSDVLGMQKLTDRKVITYGFDKSADIRIVKFKNESRDGVPFGISFTLKTNKGSVPVKIDKVFGESHAYASAAAAAVGLVHGIDFQTISERLAFYEGERGRVRLLLGIKNSFIIDDTYEASPASFSMAVGILSDIKAPRKLAILGDMLELGEYTESAHITLGKKVSRVTDLLITVGMRAEFIKEGALDAGFPRENIESFQRSDEAKIRVQELVREGDLILIKGSQDMRMEHIVKEIMAEPNRAEELLIRQHNKWLKN